MKLDRFINRPVLSTVISILIVILGVIGLATLPITQYPDIAPPTVSVSATYQVPMPKRCLTPLSLRWRTRLTVWKI